MSGHVGGLLLIRHLAPRFASALHDDSDGLILLLASHGLGSEDKVGRRRLLRLQILVAVLKLGRTSFTRKNH